MSLKWHPLHTACLQGSVSEATALLQQHPQLQQRQLLALQHQEGGWTALHFAVQAGSLHLVEVLVDFGADVNIVNHAGDTALHVAVRRGENDIIGHLIANGADPYIQNNDGCTCLHGTAERGSTVAATLILQQYPDVLAIQDSHGRSAVYIAIRKGQTEWIETVRPFNPTLVQQTCRHAGGSRASTTHTQTQIDRTTGSLVDALLDAACKGDLAKVEEVIAAGADPNASSKNGSKTALMEAASEGHLNIVNRLLACKCDVDVKNKKGLNALQLAVRAGHTHVARALLSHGASPDVVNKTGHTLSQLAELAGHDHMATWLAIVQAERFEVLNYPASAAPNRNPDASESNASKTVANRSSTPSDELGMPAQDDDLQREIQKMEEWLRSVNLHQYLSVLVENGFDSLALLTAVEEQDLDHMQFKLGHKRQFQKCQPQLLALVAPAGSAFSYEGKLHTSTTTQIHTMRRAESDPGSELAADVAKAPQYKASTSDEKAERRRDEAKLADTTPARPSGRKRKPRRARESKEGNANRSTNPNANIPAGSEITDPTTPTPWRMQPHIRIPTLPRNRYLALLNSALGRARAVRDGLNADQLRLLMNDTALGQTVPNLGILQRERSAFDNYLSEMSRSNRLFCICALARCCRRDRCPGFCHAFEKYIRANAHEGLKRDFIFDQAQGNIDHVISYVQAFVPPPPDHPHSHFHPPPPHQLRPQPHPYPPPDPNRSASPSHKSPPLDPHLPVHVMTKTDHDPETEVLTELEEEPAMVPSLSKSLSHTYKELNFDEIELKQAIGEGSFGRVRKAIWRGMDVAVKELKMDSGFEEGSSACLTELRHEARMLARVCNHTCVIPFIGVILHPRPCVVTSYMPNGSVEDLLVRSRTQVPLETVRRMSIEACLGMHHLHSEGVIHRDLAARNLLIDHHLHVRVADFGFARVKDQCKSKGYTRSDMGPIRWSAPEAMQRKCYSEASDVFSFGVVLYEMFARCAPWEGLETLDVAFRVFQRERMNIPTYIHSSLRTLMQDCWKHEPAHRPTATALIATLRDIEFMTEALAPEQVSHLASHFADLRIPAFGEETAGQDTERLYSRMTLDNDG